MNNLNSSEYFSSKTTVSYDLLATLSNSWRAFQSALAANKRPALTLANDYDALADRVRADGKNSSAVTMLTEKALHLCQRRAVVESFRLSRLSIVVGELLSGRYARYAAFWVAALRYLVEEAR